MLLCWKMEYGYTLIISLAINTVMYVVTFAMNDVGVIVASERGVLYLIHPPLLADHSFGGMLPNSWECMPYIYHSGTLECALLTLL